MPRATKQLATIIAVDPGVTSGIAILTLDPAWLNGAGEASWAGLGKAVRIKYACQIGRYPRAWDLDGDRAVNATMDDLAALHMPVLPQPLEQDDEAVWSTFEDIIDGKGKAGGGDLTTNMVNEARQVRQIAGLLDNHPRAALVLESFTLRQMSAEASLLSPERLNSSIINEEILHGVGRVPFMQQPSYAMSTATDVRLKRALLYYPGMKHATDAMRHAATFSRDLRKDADLRRAAFPKNGAFK